MQRGTLILEYGGRDPVMIPATEASEHAGKTALEAVACILEGRPGYAQAADHLRDPLRQWDVELSTPQDDARVAVDRAIGKNEKLDDVLDALKEVEEVVLAVDEHVTGGTDE